MAKTQKTLSIRLERKDVSFLQGLAEERHQNLSETVRELLSHGRVLMAVHQYRQGTTSLGRASVLAGLPVGAFMDLLTQLGVENPLPLTDYLEGLEHLRRAW
jgi:predicted HTH domain antitoxin